MADFAEEETEEEEDEEDERELDEKAEALTSLVRSIDPVFGSLFLRSVDELALLLPSRDAGRTLFIGEQTVEVGLWSLLFGGFRIDSLSSSCDRLALSRPLRDSDDFSEEPEECVEEEPPLLLLLLLPLSLLLLLLPLSLLLLPLLPLSLLLLSLLLSLLVLLLLLSVCSEPVPVSLSASPSISMLLSLRGRPDRRARKPRKCETREHVPPQRHRC